MHLFLTFTEETLSIPKFAFLVYAHHRRAIFTSIYPSLSKKLIHRNNICNQKLLTVKKGM